MDEVGHDRFEGDLLGSDPRGNVERISAAACDAARKVTDREAIVHCSYGDVPTWDYFWQLNIARTIGAARASPSTASPSNAARLPSV